MDNSHLASVQQLPRELRDKIYESTTKSFTELVIPFDFDGSLLDFFLTQLPPGLSGDLVTRDEAARAHLRRAMVDMVTVKVPNPNALLAGAPRNMLFNKVRRLEFTQPQHVYATKHDLSSTADTFTVHDAVLRCPHLREITIAVPAAMFLQPGTMNGASRYRTPADIEAATHFSGILEHTGIQEIKLNCGDGPMRDYGIPDPAPFMSFANRFLGEIRNGDRNVDFTIDLSPGVKFTPNWPECRRESLGCIKWIVWMDFFG
jgi:hypothetical protein